MEDEWLDYYSEISNLEDYDEDFPEEIRQELDAQKQLLRCFAIYTLALHSDSVHRRKMCSFTAHGLSEDEASGSKSP